MRPSSRWRATLERNPPLPRLSPAPRPVTQIKRLTPASSIAVTSTWVAFEKSLVGSKMISGPAETPSDWMTASIPVSARQRDASADAATTQTYRDGGAGRRIVGARTARSRRKALGGADRYGVHDDFLGVTCGAAATRRRSRHALQLPARGRLYRALPVAYASMLYELRNHID